MEETQRSYEDLVERAPIGIFVAPVDADELDDAEVDPDELYANPTLASILGFESVDELRAELSTIEYVDPQDEATIHERIANDGRVELFETALVANDGDPVDVLISGAIEDGQFTAYVTDISERKQLERKAAEQAEAILELSTPIVQIWEGVTLATVVGTLDTQRAQQLTEELLDELTRQQSAVALVDITGVPTIDTATAQHLIDTVNAVSLLGSEVIITGINPDIAQTLVQLGITMENIRTKSSLSEGLLLGLDLIDAEADVPA